MLRRCCVLLLVPFCLSLATRAEAVDTRLPAGTVSIDAPILLRCGAVDRYHVTQSTRLQVAGQPEQEISMVEMAGSVVPEGGDLRNEAYYIEYDGVTQTQLGPFLLDMLYSDIGEPLSVEVRELEEGTMNMPQPGSVDYKNFVNKIEVAMALTALPVQPVGMGDIVYDLGPLFQNSFGAEQSQSLHIVSSDLVSTLAGEAEIDGRRYAIAQHAGSVVFEMSGMQMRAKGSGYWTIDRENCNPGDGVLRLVMTLTQNDDQPIMVLESTMESE